jgi:alkylation response protein AidB-like acyl-CoA dehydrogenase
MSDGLFPQSYLDARDRYRAFMEEHVYPSEVAIEREDDDALALLETLRGHAREAGLWAPHVPPEAGGTGLGFLYYACLNEEIGRSAYAQLVFGCQAPDAGNAEILHLFGTDEQKERFLQPLVAGEARSFFAMTEPEVAGSDPTLLRARAVRDGDEWVISGEKNWISFVSVAGIITVFAVTDPEAPRHQGISCFVVEAGSPGLSIGKLEHKMGMHGAPTGSPVFDEVRVPSENMLGPENQGFKVAMKTLDHSRLGIAAQGLGIAQGATDYAAGYAKERRQFGQPIAEFQAIQFKIADMETGNCAGRELLYRAAAKADRGEADLGKYSAMAKLFCTDHAMRVTTEAVQILGGYGYVRDYPVERMMRDAKLTQIYEGTNEIQRIVISRSKLR